MYNYTHCICIIVYIYTYSRCTSQQINHRSTIRSINPSPTIVYSITEHRLGLLAVLVQEIEHGRMMRNEVEPRAPAM